MENFIRRLSNFDSLYLTHLPLVPHICLIESDQHWFRSWLVAFSSPSNYLNQRWFIVNRNRKNQFQWNFNQNKKLFIHEHAYQNVVCEMEAILFKGRWVCLKQMYCRHWPASYIILRFPARLTNTNGNWQGFMVSEEVPTGNTLANINMTRRNRYVD